MDMLGGLPSHFTGFQRTRNALSPVLTRRVATAPFTPQ
jgi:hypothetical protein